MKRKEHMYVFVIVNCGKNIKQKMKECRKMTWENEQDKNKRNSNKKDTWTKSEKKQQNTKIQNKNKPLK